MFSFLGSHGGQDLESDEEAERQRGVILEDEEGPKDDTAWAPGLNVGRFIWRGNYGSASVSAQAQVVLANVFFGLQRLPRDLLRSFCSALLPMPETRCKSLHAKAAALLTQVHANTIRDLVKRLRKSNFKFDEGEVVQTVCAESLPVPAPSFKYPERRDSARVMETLVTEVLAHACEGHSDEATKRCLARLAMHDVDIGDKYHSWQFFTLVESLASLYLQHQDATEIGTCLPGIGVPSHFSIIFDVISLGARSFARHESLIVTAISSVSASTGSIHAKLIGAPSLGQSHSGAQQADSYT